MSEDKIVGCIVKTKFVTASSSIFSGYINYINRENAVRNDHISDFSIYTDYMDNPEKTTDLFTANSYHLTEIEKQQYQDLYEKAQINGSPMWQTVISFDNRWLEKNGIYDSESGFLAAKKLMAYTRNAVKPMLKAEGLENAIWSAAIHYNTDNLHIHIATAEPIPTRKMVQVKTIRFSSDWVKQNSIIKGETVTFGERVAAHKNKNYAYRHIHNRITDILSKQGYNTRLLGDYITINSNGCIDLSYRGTNDLIPNMTKLIDDHWEYKGSFKESSIAKCKSSIVNQIINHSLDNKRLNEVVRNNIAASMRGNILFEDREIVRQFLYIYEQLPEQRNDWHYKVNKIAHLRPEIDKITDMYLSKYKTDEFAEFKTLVNKQAELYQEAYGGDAEKRRILNKTKDLYTRCGNAILNQMKIIDLRDIRELESSSYIAAEVNEAAVTGESTDFDGKIDYKSYTTGKYENTSKYWTNAFKEAKRNLSDVLSFEDGLEKDTALEKILSVFENEIVNGNDVAAYELGRYYKLGTFGIIDHEKSQQYLKTAFNGFINELNSDNWLKNMIAMDELRRYRQLYSQSDYEEQIKQIARNLESDEWMQNYLNYKVGRMLLDGEGTEKDILQGISHLEQSTSPFAYYTLGNLYYHSNDIEQDYEKAYEYFSLAGFPEIGEKPMPFAIYNMAEMIEKGLIEEKRFSKDELYQKALSQFISSEKENPNDLTEYKIASMLLAGKGCAVDEKAAEEYLIKSMSYGNTYAQTKLANLYMKRENPFDAKKAVMLLQIAAELGNALAQYQLGKIRIDKNSKYFKPEVGIELLEKAAEQDNDFALYTLGNVYLKGKIIDKDLNSALNYLNAAAEKGNQYAQYTLGMINLNGEGENIKPDIPTAINYLDKAAKQGNAFAQYQLGKLYLENKEIKDIKKALDFIEKVSEQDNSYLHYNLGRLYLENEDIYDVNKAISFLALSAENDNPFAAYTLGNLYSQDRFIKSDKTIADQWYKQAYEVFAAIEKNEKINTDDSILYNLGIMNQNGLGTDKNTDKGINYLLKAAQNNHEFAQYTLGKIYLQGEDVNKNTEYASLWLERAAEQGNQYAQYLLGKALLDDETIEQNIPLAIDYLNKSAEQGNDFAQYQLGRTYYYEEYGLKNIYQSLIHFTDSAEQGNQYAQYQLGLIYYKGDDIDQNGNLAIDYLNRSAEQGNQFAQYTLGIINLKGEICDANVHKAIEYFELSAEQNNQFAQYQLGKLYYFGADGIDQDREKGIQYLNLSAEQGNEYAIALLNWKPTIYTNHLHDSQSFNETMVSLSSDMRQLFERLSNEHDHMLNQMIFQKLEREKAKEDNQIQY